MIFLRDHSFFPSISINFEELWAQKRQKNTRLKIKTDRPNNLLIMGHCYFIEI